MTPTAAIRVTKSVSDADGIASIISMSTSIIIGSVMIRRSGVLMRMRRGLRLATRQCGLGEGSRRLFEELSYLAREGWKKATGWFTHAHFEL